MGVNTAPVFGLPLQLCKEQQVSRSLLSLSFIYLALIAAGEDYEHIYTSLDFNGAQHAVISLHINNDISVDEFQEEYFQVLLTSYTGPSRIKPNYTPVNITIIDDDGTYVQSYNTKVINVFLSLSHKLLHLVLINHLTYSIRLEHLYCVWSFSQPSIAFPVLYTLNLISTSK